MEVNCTDLVIFILVLVLEIVLLMWMVIDSYQTIDFYLKVIRSLMNEIKRLEKENEHTRDV